MLLENASVSVTDQISKTETNKDKYDQGSSSGVFGGFVRYYVFSDVQWER